MDPNELLKQLGIDLEKDAADLDPIDRAIDFTIYTRDRAGNGLALKAWTEKGEDGEDDMLLSGIASSTIKDLHGDTMLPTALIDMERDAKDNLTIFLNHHYDVPEDVAGSVKEAALSATAVDEATGAPIYDLDFKKLRINRENDRAIKSWKSMHGGTKLGLSIGAQIPEGGAVRNKKTGALLIAHVKLLETSIVGIPANPRSWIDAATKAYKAGPKQFPGVAIEVKEIGLGESGPETVVIAATATDTVDPVQATQAVEQTETKVSDDKAAAAGDPSTNTDAPSQDLSTSAPENDGAVATPDVIAAAKDVLGQSTDTEVPEELRGLLVEAHNALTTVTNALIEIDEARKSAEQRAEAAEAERDDMRRDTENVINAVADVLDRVGSLPAGQRTSFKNIKRDFENQANAFEGMGLAPEVVRMLRRPTT